ncbi:MAG: alpha/beta fold hydrolase [Rhodospirillaceae bacterium]|jgi:pimeloyl-ACP methyl ester carboxylesterase|nr:alpha/beta fold hydrolase [Rhodospirillaceae bacterium]MBT3886634.1 alpha/beta fold hydrolase [Rhodospirillaceae bacterium]MBT4117763.1 alpha/beta fold hydrolase [Rhodospirillaceae bacterium]MBT4671929.1 alpha/beta fold hydrolase [Rhodospirillaceae bacterium]MBT4720857.1 alpha/beta fold hydrolase [Rhodospirillaceae bacterium]
MPRIISGQFTTAYDDTGAGAPVILLHCSSSARSQWRELGETLAADFHVMAPDLLGYGDSGKWRGDAGDLIRAEAAAVRALLATANAPLHLVGHSYGAATALRFASQYPGVLKSLTLIEPVSGWLLTGNEHRDAYTELKSVADGFRGAFRAGDAETGVRQYVDYWSGPGAWDAMAKGLRTYVLATAEKTHHEFAALFDPVNAAASLDRIQAPVLLLHGAETRAPTLRILKILEAGLSNARMAAIPGAGHMSPITHRKLVNAEIVRHIKAHAD